MIIKAYGQHWRPEWIYNNGQISSRQCFKGAVNKNGKKYEIDFWKTKGIYALYKDYRVVYVGKTNNMNLGSRIRTHVRKTGGRWDTFSFFSFSSINYKTEEVQAQEQISNITRAQVIKNLEVIIIKSTNPSMNKKDEKFPGSVRAKQVNFTTQRSLNDVYDLLEKIEKSLPQIEKRKKRK